MGVQFDADARLAALVAWRDQLDQAAPARGITDYDLERIARSPVEDAGGIARLSLINRTLVSQFAPEIAAVIATLAQDPTGPAASGDAEPDPVQADPGRQQPGAYPPFAPMDLTRALDQSRAGKISDEAVGDQVRLTWSPLPVGTSVGRAIEVIYRVTSSDQAPPPAPEKGQLVATSRTPEIIDARGFVQAVRYYRVWANTGATLEDAAQSQPILVAQGAVVSPVQNAFIIERDRHVIGRWQVPPGFTKVVVHRHAPGERFSPRNALAPDRPGDLQEQGFVDRSGAPGATYEYSVYLCAPVTIDGTPTDQYSAPVTETISIPADPEPVADLQVSDRRLGDHSVFDVSWTRPSHGQVDLYLTDSPPNPGLQQRPLPAESLSTTVLAEHARIQHPATRTGETMFIDGFPWPKTWYRAYITPVTRAGGMVAVGQCRSFTRVEPVRDADIRERVDSQVVVFDWPAGATEVAAFKTPPGYPYSPDQAQPEAAIDRDRYDRLGGMMLHLRGVPVDLHLVPRAWDHAQLTSGTSLRVHYPGIYVLSYDVVQEYLIRRVFMGRRSEPDGPPRIMLHSQSERDLPDGVFLTLVHNPNRMPLSTRDGELLTTRTIPVITGSQTIHAFDLPATKPGFVRLFAQARAVGHRIALLDPDVSKLRR
jgi:hypothetical protein